MPNEQTIDEIKIKISQESTDVINGLDSLATKLQDLKTTTNGGIKGLNTVAKQLNKFSQAVANLPDLSKFEQLRDILAQIKGLGNIDISATVKDNAGVLGEAEPATFRDATIENADMSELSIQSEELQAELRALDLEIEQTNQQLNNIVTACENGSTGMREMKEQTKQLSKQAQTATDHVRELKDELNDTGDGAKKGENGITKFLASLKRIAMYRAVRAIISSITSALQEGMQNLAMYSEEVNESLSELKTSTTQLTNSLVAMLAPILETIVPVLTKIIDNIINLVNMINAVFALLQGKSSVTIATRQWQDYSESVNEAKVSLLGFDEINKLSGDSTDYSSMFETIELNETSLAALGINENWQKVFKTISDISTTITNLIDKIENSKLYQTLKDWNDKIQDIKDNIDGIVALAIVKLIEDIVDAIDDLISALTSGSWSTGVSKLLNVAAAMFVAAAAVAAMSLNWAAAALCLAVAAGIEVGSIVSNISNGTNPYLLSPQPFADGGYVTAGDLFIANEAGPELVGTMNGHTAVANNDQIVQGIKQGVYEAMTEAGDIGGNFTVQVIANGKVTANQIISAAERKNRRDGKQVIYVEV